VTDVYLAVIAVAVAAMAVIQIAVIVVAMRTAKRVGEAVSRFETDLRPIVTNLKAMSADAARTASIASAQAQRAEQLIGDVTSRVNHTVAAVEASVVAPAREAYAMVQGLLGAFSAFRQGPAPPGRRQTAAEEEDPLFIG
jgi:hypothetical protein